MKLEEMLEVVRFIVKDNNSSPDFSIDEFNGIIKAVNLDILNKKIMPYFPKFREGVLSDEELSKFVVKNNFTITNGQLQFPTDYYFGIGCIDKDTYKPIKVTNAFEYYTMISNKANRQLKFYYIAVENDNRLEFYPSNIINIDLIYFRKPKEPMLYYRYDENLGYNKIIGEDNFEWDDRLHPQIIREILNYMGIPVSLDLVNNTIQNTREK